MKKLFETIVPSLPLLYKVGAMLVTVVCIILMFPSGSRSAHYSHSVGGFWNSDDLYAPYTFAIQKAQTDIDREVAATKEQSILYFTVDSSALQVASARLDSLNLGWQERKATLRVLDAVYKKGYIVMPDDYDDSYLPTLVVLEGNVGSEHSIADFVTPNLVEEYVAQKGFPNASDAEVAQRSSQLRDKVLVPSLRYDAVRSQLELDSRLSQISSTSTMVQAGELIVAKGQYISPEIDQILSSLEYENNNRFEAHYHPFVHDLGQFILCIIAFVALYMFLNITQHQLLNDNRRVTFVLVTFLLMGGVVALIEAINPEWVLLAPVCIIPILMRVFFDMRVALYIDLTIVIILASLVPNSFEFIFYQMVTGIMSIVTVKNFERRSNFFVVAVAVFLTYSLIYTAGMLSQDTSLANLNPQRYLMFFLNGLLCLMSYPLIYVFEKCFGMTTAITLMEISSTNTPALRELSRVAPGTFQHSMQVANIAEDIVNEIGGNALLARVGGLYHDIGKTQSPLYFTENQNTGFNPHDDLEYEESARIITAHVRDGIALAKKYHLPSEVTDFIRTHHGTTTTGYFYALWQQAHPGETPDPMTFQYAGPAPYSRETAVVMIVDSVEAATKSIKNPTRESISDMVNKIIDGKIRERQLNYCDITFDDITKIRTLLIEKMMSVYHVRVAYPTTSGASDPQ